ncbi:Cbs2p Ecym_4162 [Eremothecium cymbalariae DBVPG|uniref:Ketopantoate reductase C-terminal domain-containing protein n=1 Tax=Eremothecium cymbalariae (strain CBS 270.75 / DBVPG 7215 / KCTC 17166 / NRRL Y-17582) TaxID=931890 RepID=G8JT86_ERECY|nr:hypothetical protein Ecym_4162 [Eremothecium cymbalariae DBVPG\
MSIPRVYAVGATPVASYVSYEIAKLSLQPKVPQVVLLLQDLKKLHRFLQNDSKLSFTTGGHRSDIQFMASGKPPTFGSDRLLEIENLIVGEPSRKSFSMSLNKYKKSTTPHSSILLLNPEFGLIENIYRYVWPDPSDRPQLYVGLTQQDRLKKVSEFEVKLMGSGPIHLSISPIPKNLPSYNYDDDVKYLQESIESNGLLGLLNNLKSDTVDHTIMPIFYPFGQLLLVRLRELFLASCIEPLAVLYGCQKYGELLKLEHTEGLVKSLLQEQISIFKKAYPFVENIPKSNKTLCIDELSVALWKRVKWMEHVNPKMQQDIQALNSTNVNSLNGYFVSLANYRKVACPLNQMMLSLIKDRALIGKNRALSDKYL